MSKENLQAEEVESLRVALQERTAELEAATQELEKFSYSVSHDLRAPLRAIEGFSKIVLEDYSDKLDDEGKRYLNIIDGSSRRMTTLLDDLLIFSRLGRQAMVLSEINMKEMVEAVWDELRFENGSRQIDLKISSPPDAQSDPALIHNIWKHLLGNALKFTAPRKDAKIEVSGKKEAERLVYCIKDNGVGFEMKSAQKLFGVFQRLHSAEEFPGNGIGLALVQRLVRRHGGEVWTEAKLDAGATFWFSLPILKVSSRNRL